MERNKSGEEKWVITITKCDLFPYIDFDENFFMKGVRALNQTAPVLNPVRRKKAIKR